MHLPTVLLLALTSALTSSTPLPHPSPEPKRFKDFQYGPTCDAGLKSPKTQDVTGAINKIRGDMKGWSCRVNNSIGSDCTTWAKVGGAAISVCGGFRETLDCADVADFANQVQQLCVAQGMDLVGGVFYVSEVLAVVVSHKDQ